jgi:hypothetical protein
MIAEKPTTAYVLSLVGGIFVLLGGLLWAVLGTLIALFTFGLGVILYTFVIFGALIIVGANKINNDPQARHTWAIITIVLGTISLFGVITALGGLFAIIGGALALTWQPSNPQPTPVYAPPPPPPI